MVWYNDVITQSFPVVGGPTRRLTRPLALLLSLLGLACPGEPPAPRSVPAAPAAPVATPPAPSVPAAPSPTAVVPAVPAAPAVAPLPLQALAAVPRYPAPGTPRPDAARRAQAKQLNEQGLAAYRQRAYATAVDRFAQALQQHPGHVLARYNLACNLALLGVYGLAFDQLDELRRADCGACRRQLVAAANDADFARLQADRRFQDLVRPAGALAVALDEQLLRKENALGFFHPGFPARSTDGRTVVVAQRGEDGQRGRPNLTVLELEVAHDRVLRRHVVLTVSEAEQTAPSLAGRIRPRLTRLNQELAATRWEPLARTTPPVALPACPGANLESQLLDLQVLQLEFREPRLQVRTTGPRPRRLLQRSFPGWSIPPRCPGPPPPDQTPCPEPCLTHLRLDRAWADQAGSVLLLQVGTCGGEACPQPDSTYHVLALPGLPR